MPSSSRFSAAVDAAAACEGGGSSSYVALSVPCSKAAGWCCCCRANRATSRLARASAGDVGLVVIRSRIMSSMCSAMRCRRKNACAEDVDVASSVSRIRLAAVEGGGGGSA